MRDHLEASFSVGAANVAWVSLVMNLHRARNEEIATIAAGLLLYILGIAYLFLDGSASLSWMFALPVLGMGLIFVALIAYATYQDDVREHARPPGEQPAH